jgi:hypothetical protein
MAYLMTAERLRDENRRHRDTGGVSENNRELGFLPAFHDPETGRTELSRFPNGAPAPVHMIAGLPDEWVAERDPTGLVVAVRENVIAGFFRNGVFYTREQAAQALLH